MAAESEKRPDFQQLLRQKAPGRCVAVEVLEGFRSGNGSREEREAIDVHLKQCVFCMNRLLELQELESLAEEQGWKSLPPYVAAEFQRIVSQKRWKPDVHFEWAKIPYWFTPRWEISSAIASMTVALLFFLGAGLWTKWSYDKSLPEKQGKQIALEQELKQKTSEAEREAEEEMRVRETELARGEKEEEARRLAKEKTHQETDATRLAKAHQKSSEGLAILGQSKEIVPNLKLEQFGQGGQHAAHVREEQARLAAEQRQQTEKEAARGETAVSSARTRTQEETLYEVIRNTSVLSNPRASASVLMTLEKGKLIHIVGEQGQYVRVEFSPGRYGSVLRRDVKQIKTQFPTDGSSVEDLWGKSSRK